jgi:hypothetical protein
MDIYNSKGELIRTSRDEPTPNFGNTGKSFADTIVGLFSWQEQQKSNLQFETSLQLLKTQYKNFVEQFEAFHQDKTREFKSALASKQVERIQKAEIQISTTTMEAYESAITDFERKGRQIERNTELSEVSKKLLQRKLERELEKCLRNIEDTRDTYHLKF